MLQGTIPKTEVNARIHVLLCSERKEHEGCHASVEAEIIPEIKQSHNALFQQALDPQYFTGQAHVLGGYPTR